MNERNVMRSKYRQDAETLQAKYRGVLEAVPDAFVLVDGAGRIALVNSEAARLFGYGRDELLGEVIEELVPVGARARHQQQRATYFAAPRTRPMGAGLQLAARRKDGTEFPVEISLSPLTVDETQLVIAAIRDVSARRDAAEALRRANAELESFTYSVSHDLRAPIRQIEGFSRLLTEHLGEAADPKAQHYLQRIHDGARHMARLVDDLLNLARIGRQVVRPRSVSLGDVAREAMADAMADHPDCAVEWSIQELPVIQCDPGLMKIVFTNLLSNAIKYSRPRSNARIEIGSVEHGGFEVIFVRDNGVGFDMQYADKLFGVFQRLHGPEEFEGTGVGLAIVQRIIHKHGGGIWAEAKPGQGATFSFTLGHAPPAPSS